jgi:2-isopropylmalate synthase
MTAFDHRKYRPTAQVPLANRQWPNRTLTQAPRWASVDLRDGNQALLEPMSVAQKRRLWKLLVARGFKEIEIGFPSASQPDYDFARWLIEENQIPADVTVQVLVQAREELIVRTFEALRGAPRAIVHVYNSVSTVQRERVFGMDRAAIKAIAVCGAEWVAREARKHPATEWTFEYSPESFTSTEMDYAVEVANAVIAVWQPTPEHKCIINLPSTVEVATPNVFADQVEYFVTHVDRRDSVWVSVHTHNDRGGAVASAELALLAGADRVEGTLLGNGERTGNMDVVTLAMNLYSQGIDPGLDLSNPDEIVNVVTGCTAIPLHPRHPWVGELVYTAFSGSHQDAIRKCLQKQRADEAWQVAYLPIDPRDLGRDYQAVIRINSQSGKGGVAFVLERDFGLRLPRWLQLEFAPMVQRASEQAGGEVSAAAIHRLFRSEFERAAPLALAGYRLDRAQGRDTIEAQVREGAQVRTLRGEGDGSLAAMMEAWRRASGESVHIVDYSEHALGEGTDAVAVCYVQLSAGGRRFGGVGFDGDAVSAALKAILAAVNRNAGVAERAA